MGFLSYTEEFNLNTSQIGVPVYTQDEFGITAKCCIVFQFLSKVHIETPFFSIQGYGRDTGRVHKALSLNPSTTKREREGIAA